ncbi:hypothetical protein BCR36DRAFT_412126 [Piromyces finnis]|uniref:Uncharacterized protein n=1 Tax=Piromyces finnis TaxID=1754191 RepID=A0A1Y1U7G5_9FUNG|nr:hypothetical protein BCR36DRAFT_401058 [Piromyces finnis]ORX50625.1 hypothetical protein BCR36DRAFT_412126 [Piromyces finnis]|eukprot:ORX33466.1 hypothetical protein BCR36DRAFT_401058 [Piromyces finnis]
MDFFLNWCINCGKCSEYLYCCKECRLNDLKKKSSIVNDNNYTLEFKNRKHSHPFCNVKSTTVVNRRSSSPFINIPPSTKSQNLSGSESSYNTNNEYSNMLMISIMKTDMPSVYSSPPKESKSPVSQRPRYYIQTFHDNENAFQTKPTQLLSPLSEKDNMEYENTSNVFTINQVFSEEEVNENSNRWYWSSSDDEDDDE